MTWPPSSTPAIAGPTEVTPHLPSRHLPEANWADAYEITMPREFASMRSLAMQTIGSMPNWARSLLRVRNALLAPLALKTGGAKDAPEGADCIGIFPILEETEDQIVLGLDDWHLDFRIVVDRIAEGHMCRLRATTLVTRHNAFGKLYIVLVTPFHRLIVRSVLNNAL